jgi:3-deoxy-manno-octulosonate cytidylyltransferase (CMP-KDO synthetase)
VNAGFTVIIPARHGSSRLPGKPLLRIGARSLLEHVYAAAVGSGADDVIIAVDDQRVAAEAGSFGARVVMTSSAHRSGSDRIAEAARLLDIPGDTVIVNVQGDEYGLPPALVAQTAAALRAHPRADMSTLCEPIGNADDWQDPNVVKVVRAGDGRALYFSRTPIPWTADGHVPAEAMRHLGIYAFRAAFLQRYTTLEPAPLELLERLEQLRALHHGFHIQVETAREPGGIGIDSPGDLERAAIRERDKAQAAEQGGDVRSTARERGDPHSRSAVSDCGR